MCNKRRKNDGIDKEEKISRKYLKNQPESQKFFLKVCHQRFIVVEFVSLHTRKRNFQGNINDYELLDYSTRVL